jgi:hypothetical protein
MDRLICEVVFEQATIGSNSLKRKGQPMKKMLILIVVAGAIIFGALNYHFILSDNGPKVLKKTEMTFKHTYVDARGFKKHKLLTNPALLKAGLKDAID